MPAVSGEETRERLSGIDRWCVALLSRLPSKIKRVNPFYGSIELSLASPARLLLSLVFGGLAGVSIIAVLNSQADHLDDEEYSLSLALMFCVFIVVFRFAQHYLLKNASESVDEALHCLRGKIISKLSRINLEFYETIPREDILAAMAYHYETISEFSVPMVVGVQSAVSLSFLLVYILFISPLAITLISGICGALIYAYWMRRLDMLAAREGALASETGMLGALGDVAGGFKELRLDAGKRRTVVDEIVGFSRKAADHRIRMTTIRADLIVVAQSLGYLLSATIMFALPLLGITPITAIPGIYTTVLFVLQPLQGAVSASRQLTQVRFSARRLRAFEAKLDAMIGAQEALPERVRFASLELSNATYKHHAVNDEPGFGVGPITLRLEPGDIVFVTGGNGSGKTTTIRLLIGLYFATGGELRLNDEIVGLDRIETYRQIFGAIFADFHAFHKPYGLSAEQLAVFEAQLRRLRIRDKLPADLRAGYEPAKLSTGQRKRLALALAIAEDRAVFIFDEWAADQDPEFREMFYFKILPELAAQGKAVLAVTHDDRYFDQATRRFHMENGLMTLVVGAAEPVGGRSPSDEG